MHYVHKAAEKFRDNETKSHFQKMSDVREWETKYKHLLPDDEDGFFQENFLDFKFDLWANIRIVFPWNNEVRTELIKRFTDKGWRISSDYPRKPDEKVWMTVLVHSKTWRFANIYMSAEYHPKELKNACQVISLGKSKIEEEVEIFDVICAEE